MNLLSNNSEGELLGSPIRIISSQATEESVEGSETRESNPERMKSPRAPSTLTSKSKDSLFRSYLNRSTLEKGLVIGT